MFSTLFTVGHQKQYGDLTNVDFYNEWLYKEESHKLHEKQWDYIGAKPTHIYQAKRGWGGTAKLI